MLCIARFGHVIARIQLLKVVAHCGAVNAPGMAGISKDTLMNLKNCLLAGLFAAALSVTGFTAEAQSAGTKPAAPAA